MTQETQYTPTLFPKLSLRADDDGDLAKIRFGLDGAITLPVNMPDRKHKAAFIVRACNSHDALVGALKRLLFQDSNLTEIDKTIIHVKAREALKQAGAE